MPFEAPPAIPPAISAEVQQGQSVNQPNQASENNLVTLQTNNGMTVQLPKRLAELVIQSNKGKQLDQPETLTKQSLPPEMSLNNRQSQEKPATSKVEKQPETLDDFVKLYEELKNRPDYIGTATGIRYATDGSGEHQINYTILSSEETGTLAVADVRSKFGNATFNNGIENSPIYLDFKGTRYKIPTIGRSGAAAGYSPSLVLKK